ncbi:MAG: class I SAM-dependent methyltransferase [bacterium]
MKDVDPKKYISRRLPDKVHFRIVECEKCKMIFSNPVVEEKKILNSYINSDFYPEEDIENLTDVYEYYTDIKIPKTKRNKILEIGCGNGRLLARLKKLGFKDINGLEPSKKAVAASPINVDQKKIVVDYFKENQFKQSSFDVVVFFQVLDHVVNPNKFLKEVYRILKPGGYVLAIIHNSKSLSAKLLGEASPIIDIQHINLFDKENIRKIFNINNFKVISVFSTFTTYSISYWLKIIPIPKVVKNLFKNLNILNRINVKMYAGNMGILAVKTK